MKEGNMRGRPKGGTNKYWSKEDKLKIVKRVIEDDESMKSIEKSDGINNGMISKWVKLYLENGEEGLINKKKPGNPLSKYQSKKNLTREEKLEYENMKLRIELERLKKGYQVKGDGLNKQFITINKKSLK